MLQTQAPRCFLLAPPHDALISNYFCDIKKATIIIYKILRFPPPPPPVMLIKGEGRRKWQFSNLFLQIVTSVAWGKKTRREPTKYKLFTEVTLFSFALCVGCCFSKIAFQDWDEQIVNPPQINFKNSEALDFKYSEYWLTSHVRVGIYIWHLRVSDFSIWELTCNGIQQWYF